MSGKRTPYFDLVKGLAIILVVIGHCIQYGSGTEFLSESHYYSNLPFRAIYSFHMPLFMLVSGFLFFKTCEKYNWKKVLLTKLMGLGIPILVWGTIDFIIEFAQGTRGNIYQIIKNYIWDIIGAPWFLWATFMCSIAVLLFRLSIKDKTWILLISIPIVLLIPDKFNLLWFKFMYPYFVVGYLWNKHNFPEEISKKQIKKVTKIFALIGVALIWICLLCFFHENQFIYTTRMQIIGNATPMRQLGIDLFRWFIGFVGSALALIIISFIPKCSLLQSLGKHSLGIYLINIYVNLYILKPLTAKFSSNILLNLIESIVVITVCYIGSWLLSKNNILNRIFLGGR